MDPGLDPGSLQLRLYLAPPRHADGIGVENVTGPGQDPGKRDPARRQQLAIPRGVGDASFGPGLQVAQFDAENRALDAFQTIVVASQTMFIFLIAAPIAQQADRLGMPGVVGDHHTAFSAGARFLVG